MSQSTAHNMQTAKKKEKKKTWLNHKVVNKRNLIVEL